MAHLARAGCTGTMVRAMVVLGVIAATLMGSSASAEAADGNLALGRPATASSGYPEYGYVAGVLVDGVAAESSLWQNRAGDPAPSWQVDLGSDAAMTSIGLAFAGYQGAYYGVPREITVSVLDDCDGQAQQVLTVPATATPSSGSPYQPAILRLSLPPGTHGRILRLDFPQGAKPDGSGNVALSEVQVFGPSAPSPAPPPPVREDSDQVVDLDGRFGTASVDLTHPQLTALRLRQPNGELGASLVSAAATTSATGIRHGGYSYLVDACRRRFDSRTSSGHDVSISRDGDGKPTGVLIHGIRPADVEGATAPVTEDWEITSRHGQLAWRVVQHWQRDVHVQISGAPAIHIHGIPGLADRSRTPDVMDATSTFWYQPDQIVGDDPAHCPGYFVGYLPGQQDTVCQIIAPQNTWATYKLWTDTHEHNDLRLDVSGDGHLYRRGGSTAQLNEIGSVDAPQLDFERKAGDTDATTLRVRGVEKRRTGQQLDVRIPDRETGRLLGDLYGSLFNGGTVSNQKKYTLGNETEGFEWLGSTMWQGLALSAGVAAPGRLSEQPYDLDSAMRGQIDNVWSTVDGNGLPTYGYQPTPDVNLNAVLGTRAYVVKTGDLTSARGWMPAIERALGHFERGIDPVNGLYLQPTGYAAQYYDQLGWDTQSKYNSYYQAFLYKALVDAAELEQALGMPDKAAHYRAVAQRLAQGVNEVLWQPDAPGGPRYADWIDPQGVAQTYFIDIYQYPLIAFGIAPPDRARQVLATADARMAELRDQNGYTRECTVSSLWPQPWSQPFGGFGTYMDGGCLLASTYWEVLARAQMGEVDGEWGAYRLLQRFAKLFERTSFVGYNSMNMQGQPHGWNEPYLSDSIVTPAALVHAIIGVDASWDGLNVHPHLPQDWQRASARIEYKGEVYRIGVGGKKVRVKRD